MKRGKVFYGVWILIGVWLIYLLSSTPGAYGSSVITTRIVHDNGWSEGVIGAVTSIYYLCMSLIALPAGIINKKKGPKLTLYIGSFVGIASYIILAYFAKNPLVYILTFIGVGAISAMGGVLTCPALITQWYERNRALPMSILLTSGSVGGFLMPILVNLMLEVNTTLCWQVFIVMAVAAILINFFLIKNQPEDVGEIKDGYHWIKHHPLKAEEIAQASDQVPALKHCYRSRPFWLLSFQMFAARASHAGITSYIIAYAMQNQISALQGSLLITIYNIASFFGRFSVGLLDRRMKEGYMNFIALALVAVECLSLFMAIGYGSFLFSVTCGGLGFGALCTLVPLLISGYFNSENFNVLNGTLSMIGTLGSAVSPILIFMVAKLVGGYKYAYGLLGCVLAVATVTALLVPVRQIPAEK